MEFEVYIEVGSQAQLLRCLVPVFLVSPTRGHLSPSRDIIDIMGPNVPLSKPLWLRSR